MSDKKILGDERRKLILEWLKDTGKPVKGGELAERTNVSRQVIVQDISLLKARKEPIIATSQGYMYFAQDSGFHSVERVIACKHDPEDTEAELMLLVDYGVTVKDVIIEHPVYGDLTASIMVSNRKEVEQFLKKMKKTNASLLSELTDGTHLHTIMASSEADLDDACRALQEAGYLLES